MNTVASIRLWDLSMGLSLQIFKSIRGGGSHDNYFHNKSSGASAVGKEPFLMCQHRKPHLQECGMNVKSLHIMLK